MNDSEKLLNLIDDNEVIQVAQDLVAIPSITHHEGRGMVTYLERWFRNLDIPVRLYPCSGERANFFADYGACEGPGRFLFNGHQDTKPVDGMTVDPFGGMIRDGKMYGRGACDMKGAIAALLCAFKVLVRAGSRPRGGITFFSDIEEEYAGYDGFPSLMDRGLTEGYEGVISCEPTELEIHIGNMGGICTTFEISGRATDTSLAGDVVNPVHAMAHFITEYLKLPYIQEENPYFGKCTVNFELIRGGLFHSTVPDRCIASIDSRIIPETPAETVQKQYRSIMNHMNRDSGISVREIDPPENWRPRGGFEDAAYISPDHELTKRVARAVKRATGNDAVISGMPGATFAGQMIRSGTPSIICGPGSIKQAHTEDEWVDIEQLPKAARIYTMLMADM